MKVRILLTIAAIVAVTILGMPNFGNTVAAENDTDLPLVLNQTLVTPDDNPMLAQLLAQHGQTNGTYKKFEFRDGDVVYNYQRMIGNITVEGDFINCQVSATGEPLKNFTHWRDNLTGNPNITITKEEAINITGGGGVALYYISPDSAVFSTIDPIPQDPCWINWKRDGNGTLYNITVVDAQNGTILGYGIPPPSPSFVYAGPIDQVNCTGIWGDWYDNAQDWFWTMGYSPDHITYPSIANIKSYIQDCDTALIYGVAHGNNQYIRCGCNMTAYSASNVRDWLAGYPPIRFAFLASCDAMKDCDMPWTFGYEFRKGSVIDTAVVGYIGMVNASNETWLSTLPWQENFFSYLADGQTVGYATVQASKDYPLCTGYIRFIGDAGLTLVPKLNRYIDTGTEEQTSFNNAENLKGGERAGQRLTIPGRVVTSLSFPLFKAGSPTGDVVFTIRAVSDDHIINSKIWGDASTLPTGIAETAWEEVTFDNPVSIDEEVRLLVEPTSGDFYDGVRLCLCGHTDVKPDEYFTEYTDYYDDYSYADAAYSYTYGECGVPTLGIVLGEVHDVNHNPLSNVKVSLYEFEDVYYKHILTTSPGYIMMVDQTGDYYLVGIRATYYEIDTANMAILPPLHIDLTTPEKLEAGYRFDFEGDYGLVPRTCNVTYAMISINHWLFTPVDVAENLHPEWQLSSWKAMEVVHSWQYPS